MCGICGMVGRGNEAELGLMTDAMAHRGPDGRGVVSFDGPTPAGLGHRRLAILDPTPAGAQPMSLDGRWWITYNGEIYNFRELRAELEHRGERFASDCDTEVLLRLFALDGPAMLGRLNGIFAFAVWDDRDHRLFLARDRLGVRDIVWRRKAGFGAPIRSWLLKDLAPLIRDALSEGTLARRSIVDPPAVARLVSGSASGRADNSLQIDSLLTLELWMQTFLDRPWSFDDQPVAPAAAGV